MTSPAAEPLTPSPGPNLNSISLCVFPTWGPGGPYSVSYRIVSRRRNLAPGEALRAADGGRERDLHMSPRYKSPPGSATIRPRRRWARVRRPLARSPPTALRPWLCIFDEGTRSRSSLFSLPAEARGYRAVGGERASAPRVVLSLG